jgi:hypothetical protein
VRTKCNRSWRWWRRPEGRPRLSGPNQRLRSAVPHEDAGLAGGVVEDAESAEVVPGDAARATEIARKLRADLLRDTHRLVHRIGAHEVRPARLGVVPCIGGAGVWIPRGRVVGAALRNEVLLDEAAALITADLAVIDLLLTFGRVLRDIRTGALRPVPFVEVLPVSTGRDVRDGDLLDAESLGYRGTRKPGIDVAVDQENVGFGELGVGVLLAHQSSALLHHVLHVVGWRSGKNMIRIAARRHIAFVATVQSIGDWPLEVLVAEPVNLEDVLLSVLRDLEMQIALRRRIRCVAGPASAVEFADATQKLAGCLVQNIHTNFFSSSTFGALWITGLSPTLVVRPA